MKKFISATICFSVFALSLFCISVKSEETSKPLKDIFKEFGILINGVGDFVVQKNIRKEGLENSFWTIVAEKDGKVIKIEAINNINSQEARKYAEERQNIVKALYQRIPSPYPGMISNVIECPDELKPEIVSLDIEGKIVSAYILYSTPRFTYGAGVEELIKYRGVLMFIYGDKVRTLYRVEIFIPKEKFNKKEIVDILKSIRLEKGGSYPKQDYVNASEKAWGEPYRKTDISEGYNLIIIGFDPLGAKHIGAYGYHRNTTPNLDNFSKKAFLFKNAISSSSWTLPSFMSWFTSLYPSQHKIVNKYSTYTEEKQVLSNLSTLSPSVVTLAQILKRNGYLTAGFTGDAGVGGVFGYSLGFDVYYDKIKFAGFDIVLPMALDWLNEHRLKKFFLFIQGYDVHGQHSLGDDFRNIFVSKNYDGKYRGTTKEYWDLRNKSLEQKCLEMNDEDINFWNAWYDTKIYKADQRLGNFFKEIEKLGLMENTVVVISSASGNEFYEHKRFDHGHSLYDELVHVPLVIRVPEKNGCAIESQVRTIDIMPTVLDLLNIEIDKNIKYKIQGVSLASLMEGNELDLDAFSETDYLSQVFKRSIRTHNGWKFIYSIETEQRELYNLNEDPYEAYNLINKEQKIAYELEQRIFNWSESLKRK